MSNPKQKAIETATKIQGWVSVADLDVLWDLVMEHVSRGGLMVEVGVWKGCSTYVMASVCKLKNAYLVAIDTFAGVENPDSYKNKPDNVGSYYEALVNPNFHKIFLANMKDLPVITLKGDSQLVHEFLPDGYFDFCFLDGNHNSPAIDNDIKNFLPKIRKGGVISGHDHGNPEGDVHTAVERAFGSDWITHNRPGVATSIWTHAV